MVQNARSKKGKTGAAAQYMTRNQALKKLQVSLPDFRRLCILKGVYPREPSKKAHGKDKVYYYAKDILWLSHERVLGTFRELKTFLKKFKKAVAKGDVMAAQKLEQFKPRYSLNHIVRERYPTFTDALRDMDDALCMVQLFSTMPSDDKLFRARVSNCQKLVKEFYTYVMRSRSLNKVFLSIKGIYYQAEVMGQNITWVAPYQFTPTVDPDVDLKVMLSFLEFYEVLLHFINCKLYHEAALEYPPKLAPVWEPDTKDGAMAALGRLAAKDEAADMELEQAATEGSKLFEECVFYLSREVPCESLVFVITSFGGQVYWGDHPVLNHQANTSITHHVVDRPKLQGTAVENREYVQPQWIYDCINNNTLLPTFEYQIGHELPAHLSPFVDNDAEGYMPQRQEYLKRLAGEAPAAIEGGDAEAAEDSDDEPEETKKTSAEEDQAVLARSLLSRKKRNLYHHIKKEEDDKKSKNATLTKKRKGNEQGATSKRTKKGTSVD